MESIGYNIEQQRLKDMKDMGLPDKLAEIDHKTGNTKVKHAHIKDIKVYSDIDEEGVKTEHWEHAQYAHQEKVERFKRQKKFEAFLQDDEDDFDAEKVYCDVKNLGEEKQFNTYFNHFDDFSYTDL